MSEIREVAEALDGLRAFLNAYGDSDLSVIRQARNRILHLIEENRALHERERERRRPTGSCDVGPAASSHRPADDVAADSPALEGPTGGQDASV